MKKLRRPALLPILAREVGPRFLAWSDANAKAHALGHTQTELRMDGQRFHQNTFKYPARTLGVLREKFRQAAAEAALVELLDASGCLQYLESDT
jgi:hypothetical protein